MVEVLGAVMKFLSRFFGVMVFGAISLTGLSALAEDIEGSADHPLLSRYDGSSIRAYATKAYDEYSGILGRSDTKGGYEDTIPLEGKVTRILYAVDRERSTLEVFRNYENELKKAGFLEIFQCANDECGYSNFGKTGFIET